MRLPQSTLAQNFDEHRRACSHFCLWRINSPYAPTSTRFSPTSSPLMVRRLGKLMPRSCSGKPQSESVANPGRRAFWGGPYRGAWGSACRLAKLSRNCEHGGQRGLRRVADHHAASTRPVAEDSPYLPEAEASTASLRRCRKGECSRYSGNGRPRSHGRADDANRDGPLHVVLARGGKGCAAQRHCFGTACRRSAECACLLVGRGPSSGGW